jgi:hypothetical protein
LSPQRGNFNRYLVASAQLDDLELGLLLQPAVDSGCLASQLDDLELESMLRPTVGGGCLASQFEISVLWSLLRSTVGGGRATIKRDMLERRFNFFLILDGIIKKKTKI